MCSKWFKTVFLVFVFLIFFSSFGFALSCKTTHTLVSSSESGLRLNGSSLEIGESAVTAVWKVVEEPGGREFVDITSDVNNLSYSIKNVWQGKFLVTETVLLEVVPSWYCEPAPKDYLCAVEYKVDSTSEKYVPRIDYRSFIAFHDVNTETLEENSEPAFEMNSAGNDYLFYFPIMTRMDLFDKNTMELHTPIILNKEETITIKSSKKCFEKSGFCWIANEVESNPFDLNVSAGQDFSLQFMKDFNKLERKINGVFVDVTNELDNSKHIWSSRTFGSNNFKENSLAEEFRIINQYTVVFNASTRCGWRGLPSLCSMIHEIDSNPENINASIEYNKLKFNDFNVTKLERTVDDTFVNITSALKGNAVWFEDIWMETDENKNQIPITFRVNGKYLLKTKSYEKCTEPPPLIDYKPISIILLIISAVWGLHYFKKGEKKKAILIEALDG